MIAEITTEGNSHCLLVVCCLGNLARAMKKYKKIEFQYIIKQLMPALKVNIITVLIIVIIILSIIRGYWINSILSMIRGYWINSIHLLTGYEGNSTFIVPKVPTIFRGNAEENS
jgi:hypothetical protein